MCPDRGDQFGALQGAVTRALAIRRWRYLYPAYTKAPRRRQDEKES